MAIIGDILECTFNFSQGNKTANMVQFYEVTASTGGGVLESDIGYTLNEGMLAIAPTWLHTSAVYNGLYVKNMTNGLNYNERVEAESGDIGGDPAAAFIAASVKQQVGTLLTRAGFKRLPFIGEAQMNGETWVIGSTQETAILDYLKAHPSVCWVARFNSGVMVQDGRYTAFNGLKGCPDIMGMLVGGAFFGIEVKSQTGKATPAQLEFIDKTVKGGGLAGIARSIEDVDALLFSVL